MKAPLFDIAPPYRNPEVGDTVSIIRNQPWELSLPLTGTVVMANAFSVGVSIPKWKDGHDCGGCVKNNSGWFFRVSDVEVIYG